MKKQFFFFSAVLICFTAIGQNRTEANNVRKTTVALKSVKVDYFKNSENTVNYSAWKNGKYIYTNDLGSDDNIYRVTINNSWSVSAGAYALLPKEGMVSVQLRLQNKKKYLATVHYSTSSYLKMTAQIQYSSDKQKDYDIDVTQETQDFYPDKKWPGTFSFIIDPELVKLGNTANPPGVGYPVLALVQLSIPEVKIKESGKSDKDYNFNYQGIEIKEIQ